MQALLIYCKIDVEKKVTEIAKKKDLPVNAPKLMTTNLKVTDLEKELESNKKLIAMTAGDEDGEEDEGSDSEPSEDNLEEEELAKIVPVKKKPEPVKPAPPKVEKKPVPPMKRKNSKAQLVDAKANSS